ncbi:hypothetical protein BD293_0254 [Roseinatronobacter monicus]|uniref:Uncharacterized protein n=1 Tax=Roseinatronobacter monicus TaxID=393481 RepID=A0A543K9B8_9RHOB|nr:hypothetical protein BD293_0254 [Roseinatronobacter monicus]
MDTPARARLAVRASDEQFETLMRAGDSADFGITW